nr:hypothetical protein [Bacteroidota bacterium]
MKTPTIHLIRISGMMKHFTRKINGLKKLYSNSTTCFQKLFIEKQVAIGVPSLKTLSSLPAHLIEK